MTAIPPPTMCPKCKFHNPHHRPDCPVGVKAQEQQLGAANRCTFLIHGSRMYRCELEANHDPPHHNQHTPHAMTDEQRGRAEALELMDRAEFVTEHVLFKETIAADKILQQGAIADLVETVGIVEAARPFDEHDHASNCPDCRGSGSDDGSVHGPGCRWRCKAKQIGVQCVKVRHAIGYGECRFNLDEVIEATAPHPGALADPNVDPIGKNIIGAADAIPAVDHPDHYNAGGIECIDAIRSALTDEEFAGFCKGNALKYIWRERYKNGATDQKKAQWYLDKLLEDLT